WNLPEESEETLRNGWHHTGDLFRMEESGLVRMVDRKKYLIKTGGENVYPQEVEIVLLSHDSVADAAVIGILDEQWGETIKAFVIKKPGKEVTGKELSDWVKKHIAGYKAPRFVEFVDAIPRNASGKVLKGELKDKETTPDQKI
ncbi:MAG: AMP-binding protein, partial [Deltaproteobacteria bacterium]